MDNNGDNDNDDELNEKNDDMDREVNKDHEVATGRHGPPRVRWQV